MLNDSEPEKKVRIRPRGLDDKGRESAEAQEDGGDTKKLKWDTRLRQSGVKFPAKHVSKPIEKAAEAVGPEEPAPSSAQDPGEESPEKRPTSKDQQPEGWESSMSSSPEPDKKVENPEAGKLEVGNIIKGIRRRVRKRVRVSYALAAGFVAAAFIGVITWNLGVGAGMRSSLEQETKEKATVSREFLAELDQALAELRTGDTDKAVKKLQELEQRNTGVASLSYLLAMAAVQNGDIPLAEAKTVESLAKRERISDTLALQAVLETQKGADASIKKFGDTRMRSELLLRQAMLADAANPFPMVELATLLRYQKRTDEALALLRGARSRLNPVDSHSVVDVTINLATLQETPDAGLPQVSGPGTDLASAFSAAYVAMRKGEFDQAAASVKIAQKLAPPDLFYYLINDPALRRYATEPALQEFFR